MDPARAFLLPVDAADLCAQDKVGPLEAVDALVSAL